MKHFIFLNVRASGRDDERDDENGDNLDIL